MMYWYYKETGMLKWEKMQQVTGRESVDAITMQIQLIDATDSLNLLAIMHSF